MSDDDMEDVPESKDLDDSGMHPSRMTASKQKLEILVKAVQAAFTCCLKNGFGAPTAYRLYPLVICQFYEELFSDHTVLIHFQIAAITS